jgi:hypothetical protein
MLPQHPDENSLDMNNAIALFGFDRNLPLLINASPDIKLSPVQIEVGNVETENFTASQTRPRRISKL